jgi:two-component sensor histidine kinase
MAVSSSGGGSLLRSDNIEITEQLSSAVTSAIGHSSKELDCFIPTNLIPKLEQAMKPLPGPPGALPWNPLPTLLDLLAYGSLAGVSHAVLFYRRFREREHRAFALETHLTKARLNNLHAQLQPHFLFNTLNAIATLLRRDPKAAEATLTSLSELLRLALSQSDKQEIPLRDEMRFLERYIEIQQTRFGDRFHFEQAIQPKALDCLIPTLTLQPLVENAIRHGIEPSTKPGTVQVTACSADGRLVVSVEDDGVGFSDPPEGGPKSGIGLSNLRARLQTIYGVDQSFEIRSRPEGGVIVKVDIPSRASVAESVH